MPLCCSLGMHLLHCLIAVVTFVLGDGDGVRVVLWTNHLQGMVDGVLLHGLGEVLASLQVMRWDGMRWDGQSEVMECKDKTGVVE